MYTYRFKVSSPMLKDVIDIYDFDFAKDQMCGYFDNFVNELYYAYYSDHIDELDVSLLDDIDINYEWDKFFDSIEVDYEEIDFLSVY